jgi:hypothetical protein
MGAKIRPPCDVFDPLLAQILEGVIDPVAHQIPDDPARNIAALAKVGSHFSKTTPEDVQKRL